MPQFRGAGVPVKSGDARRRGLETWELRTAAR